MKAPVQALAWLGRHGTRAVALSAFIGMALPPLSALFRPFVEEAIFCLLVLAFLRVAPVDVLTRLRRPRLVLLATIWIVLAVPLILGAVARAFGLPSVSPDLAVALFLVTAAPPIMSAPAFVSLLGLNGGLSLALLIVAMLVTPLTVPLIGEVVLGQALPISSVSLAVRLVLLLAGTAGLAWVIRRIAGADRIAARSREIDGLSVILLLFFAVAVMDGVAASFLARPGVTLAILALSFVMAFGQMAVTRIVFRKASPDDGFVLAHAAGNRNMGLIVAALGGTLPDLAWLYFGLGQIPIYVLPLLLRPMAGKLAQAARSE
ncbi:sodium:proton symporter [Stappia sp. F7233]|uniref:Sodium:proton symporter n=1 Tax=Stappia albiluteola TaxID=2758565 RepID=A0A839ADQ3_9HYPH|nr:sodium:proton symporter [Stappia albiluteola]